MAHFISGKVTSNSLKVNSILLDYYLEGKIIYPDKSFKEWLLWYTKKYGISLPEELKEYIRNDTEQKIYWVK